MQPVIAIERGVGIDDAHLKALIEQSVGVSSKQWKKVLLLPPDITRIHSRAGRITAILYEMLKDMCEVDILPAVGSHFPMDEAEVKTMFGDIPFDRFIPHDWRHDVVNVGTVPASFTKEISDGLFCEDIPVQLNRHLLDPSYDRILSIGQVVPHEVVGLANYSKNIFVGCGGNGMIQATHYLGALYGMERIMGKDKTPVRDVFDYAQTHFADALPLDYILTVIGKHEGDNVLSGYFFSHGREGFTAAAALSRELNLNWMERPMKKVVCFMDPEEFRSTWVGNKAVYRTRMAIADGGELLILAPAVRQFGEDPDNDKVIRRYGYTGTENIMRQVNEGGMLAENRSAAAHLIHGSSDGRFRVTYAVAHLTREEIESVGFRYCPYEEAAALYNPAVLKDGWNWVNGEEIFYISNPALGLWIYEKK